MGFPDGRRIVNSLPIGARHPRRNPIRAINLRQSHTVRSLQDFARCMGAWLCSGGGSHRFGSRSEFKRPSNQFTGAHLLQATIVSSNAVEASRAGMRTAKKSGSTISGGMPPSFISLDHAVSGGVGEFPMPHSGVRDSKDPDNAHQRNTASVFSFGDVKQNSTLKILGHPSTNIFPEKQTISPIAASPVARSNLHPKKNAPSLTFATAHRSGCGFFPRLFNHSTTSYRPNGPISTPKSCDCYTSHFDATVTTNSGPQNPLPFVFPKGKDRWLSAGTWCDALFSARPRLTLKHQPPLDEEVGGWQIIQLSSSRRNLSPRGTPLAEAMLQRERGHRQTEEAVASRVLLHSRSLVSSSKGVALVGETTTKVAKTSRPTNWSQGDLAVSPSPLLSRYVPLLSNFILFFDQSFMFLAFSMKENSWNWIVEHGNSRRQSHLGAGEHG